MNSDFKRLSFIALGISGLFVGCSDKDNGILDLPIEDIEIVESGYTKNPVPVENKQATAILGSGGEMAELLKATFTNIVEANKAKHVIVALNDLEAYKEDVLKAYQRGILITVTDADPARVAEWCDDNGLVYTGDPTSDRPCRLTSFNRKANAFSMQRAQLVDGIDDYEVPLFNSFSTWVDKVLTPNLMGPDFRSRDIHKRFTPQKVTHTFLIDLPSDQIEASGWALPENANIHTTADVEYSIYPLHAFADNTDFSGDIYIVEANVKIHNADLFIGRWQYRQGDLLSDLKGFYLSECRLSNSLAELKNGVLTASSEHQLAAGPAPVTGIVTDKYQSGFDWTFDGWLTGGNGLESTTPTPIQEGGWIYDGKAEHEMKDLEIETVNDASNVSFGLTVMNLPEKGEGLIPEISSGDLVFNYSWIWKVPQAVDDSDYRYFIEIGIEPVYKWHKALRQGSQFEDKTVAPEVAPHRFMIIPPSRREGQRI